MLYNTILTSWLITKLILRCTVSKTSKLFVTISFLILTHQCKYALTDQLLTFWYRSGLAVVFWTSDSRKVRVPIFMSMTWGSEKPWRRSCSSMNFSPWYSTSRKYRGTMSLIAGSELSASYTWRSASSGPPLRFFQMVPGPAGAKQSGCPDSWNHEFCLFFRRMSLAGAVRSRAFWKYKTENTINAKH